MKSKLKLFISGLLLSVILITGLIFADTNGIWHNAEDVKPGIFGSDEAFSSDWFGFNNVVRFQDIVNLTNNTYYKNVELDARYVNENQVNSINSNMIIDNSINNTDILDDAIGNADINFNYANSSSKGGVATNSNSCNGDVNCEVNSIDSLGRIFVTGVGIAPSSGIGLISYYSGVLGVLDVKDFGTGNAKNLLITPTGGNVGIGLSSTPTQKLDVNGYIKGTGLCIGTDCKTSWPTGGGSSTVPTPPVCTGNKALQWDGTNWICTTFTIPAQNGVCGSSALSCSVGSAISDNSQTSCNTYRTWTCQGLNGGSNSGSCSYYNGNCAPSPVNGICGSSILSCSAGTPILDNLQTSCNYYRSWTCQGLNGGSNSGSCNYYNGNCAPSCASAYGNSCSFPKVLPASSQWTGNSATWCNSPPGMYLISSSAGYNVNGLIMADVVCGINVPGTIDCNGVCREN